MYKKIKLKTEDNIVLEVNHYTRDNKKVIIIAHGFFQNKDTKSFKMIAELLTDDFDVISMDFRGHGSSKGFYTFGAKETMDLNAILDYAKQEYDKIGVMGFSMGAFISICSASETDLIDSLISISAPYEFGKINYHFWKKEAFQDLFYNLSPNGNGKGVRLGNLFLRKPKPIKHITDLKIPVCFIHGENDWLIRPHHSKILYESTQSEKKLEIFKDANHAEMVYEKHPEKFKTVVIEWFNKTL